MRALFAGLLLFVASTCFAQILESPDRGLLGVATGPEFLPVEEAYQLEIEILDAQQVRLYWQIADNYYLYQHRFTFSLEDSAGTIELAAEFPPALERTDEYFGEVQVYYQQADIILLNGAHYAKWVEKVSLPASKTVDTSRKLKDQYIYSTEATTHSHGSGGAHAPAGYP